ncbi:hypothetical protein DESC_720204 [Desulfosarcina cetonica]|nr:hypothetical protein DESC_720204 [Desulfosarcina cetonica]
MCDILVILSDRLHDDLSTYKLQQDRNCQYQEQYSENHKLVFNESKVQLV